MLKKTAILLTITTISLNSCSMSNDSINNTSEILISETDTTEKVYEKSEKIEDKIVVLTSLNGISDQIKTNIDKFNDMDNGYRVEVKDYSNFLHLPPDDYSGDDLDELFEEAYTNFTKDAYEDFSENVGADIISYSTDCLVFEKLKESNCLVDLYQFENDERIDTSGLNNAVIDLCENDGRLFELPVSYSVSTLISSKKYINVTDIWTINDLISSYNSVSDSVIFTNTNSRHEAGRCLISYNLKTYFESSDECIEFFSDELRDTLNFCIQFSDINRTYTDETENVPYFLMGLFNMSNFQDFHNEVEKYEKCNGEFEIIGFPSSKGYHSNIDILESYGINAKSTDEVKIGALKFLKFIVSENTQSEFTDGFPVNNTAFYNLASTSIKQEQLTRNEYEAFLNCINNTKCRNTSDVIDFRKNYSIYISDAVNGYTSVDESIENIKKQILIARN